MRAIATVMLLAGMVAAAPEQVRAQQAPTEKPSTPIVAPTPPSSLTPTPASPPSPAPGDIVAPAAATPGTPAAPPSTELKSDQPAPAATAAAAAREKSGAAASGTADRLALPHDLSPWSMFLAADVVVKTVMVGLAAASFLVWTIWLGKIVQLWLARRRLARDLSAILGQTSIDAAAPLLKSQRSLAAVMIDVARRELRTATGSPNAKVGDRVYSRLSDIEARVGREIRGGMSFLATIGATAPFIGLFGTVWGIMNSFIGISRSQTTNLAVVAPGIAEALLATAIGLVAAIPAVIFYNQLGQSIAGFRRLTRETKSEVDRIVSRQLDGSGVPRARAPVALAAE